MSNLEYCNDCNSMGELVIHWKSRDPDLSGNHSTYPVCVKCRNETMHLDRVEEDDILIAQAEQDKEELETEFCNDLYEEDRINDLNN